MKISCCVGIGMLGMALSGCAGMHLYSAARDEEGKDLRARTVSQQKLTQEYVAAMEAQSVNVRESGLAALADVGALSMEAALQGLLSESIGDGTGGPGSFVKSIDTALDTLGTALWDDQYRQPLDSYRSQFRKLTGALAKQATYRQLIEAEGVAAPACPALAWPDGAAPDAQTQDLLTTLAGQCKIAADAQQAQSEAIARLPNGALKASASAVAQSVRAHADATAQAGAAMAAYRAALAQYSAAVLAERGGAAPSERLAQAGAKVRHVLSMLTAAGNVLGREAIAKDRVERIDGILSRLGTVDEPDFDATRAQVAAVLVTRVADDAHVLAELTKPQVRASLVIERDLAKSRAELAHTEADLARRAILLDQMALASKMDAAFMLQKAHRLAAPLAPCYPNVQFVDAVTMTPPRASCRAQDSVTNLYDAGAAYLYATGHQSTDGARVNVLRQNLERERTVALGRNSLEMWTVLIDATSGQVVTYAASGQKASDYQQLVQSVLLLGITNGVYK